MTPEEFDALPLPLAEIYFHSGDDGKTYVVVEWGESVFGLDPGVKTQRGFKFPMRKEVVDRLLLLNPNGTPGLMPLTPSEFERQNNIAPCHHVVDVGTGLIFVTAERTRDDIIRDQKKHQSECA